MDSVNVDQSGDMKAAHYHEAAIPEWALSHVLPIFHAHRYAATFGPDDIRLEYPLLCYH